MCSKFYIVVIVAISGSGWAQKLACCVGTDITQTLVDDFQDVLQQTQTTENTGRRRRQASSSNREVFTFDPNFNASAVSHSLLVALPYLKHLIKF